MANHRTERWRLRLLELDDPEQAQELKKAVSVAKQLVTKGAKRMSSWKMGIAGPIRGPETSLTRLEGLNSGEIGASVRRGLSGLGLEKWTQSAAKMGSLLALPLPD